MLLIGIASIVVAFIAMLVAFWSAYQIVQLRSSLSSQKTVFSDDHLLSQTVAPTGTETYVLNDDNAKIVGGSDDAPVNITPVTQPQFDGEYTVVTLADLRTNRTKYNGKHIEIADFIDTGPLPLPDGTKKYMEYIKIESPDYSQGIDLVRPPFVADDSNRYIRFGPLYRGVQKAKIKGKFVIDLMKTPTRPIENDVIVVDNLEVLPYPEAEKRVVNQEILSQMEKDGSISALNQKRIVYEGEYSAGFELSTLDKKIWVYAINTENGDAQTALSKYIDEYRTKNAKTGNISTRVRMTGIFHVATVGRYGHLGYAPYLLMADTITFLDQ